MQLFLPLCSVLVRTGHAKNLNNIFHMRYLRRLLHVRWKYKLSPRHGSSGAGLLSIYSPANDAIRIDWSRHLNAYSSALTYKIHYVNMKHNVDMRIIHINKERITLTCNIMSTCKITMFICNLNYVACRHNHAAY